MNRCIGGFIATVVVAVGLVLTTASSASADSCESDGNLLNTHTTCTYGPKAAIALFSSGDGHHYAIVLSCSLGGGASCSEAQTCPGPPPGTLFDVLRDGEKIGSTCLDDDTAETLGEITAGLVRKAFERLTWPKSDLNLQPPDGTTLVGFATNFYTDNNEPTTQTVTLLGQQVTIEATPTSYLWHFGDGTDQTTTTPGAAYPNLLVTHQYQHASTAVHPSVDTTYTGRYRTGNGPWLSIRGTLTVTGEPGELAVREAQGVLTGNH